MRQALNWIANKFGMVSIKSYNENEQMLMSEIHRYNLEKEAAEQKAHTLAQAIIATTRVLESANAYSSIKPIAENVYDFVAKVMEMQSEMKRLLAIEADMEAAQNQLPEWACDLSETFVQAVTMVCNRVESQKDEIANWEHVDEQQKASISLMQDKVFALETELAAANGMIEDMAEKAFISDVLVATQPNEKTCQLQIELNGGTVFISRALVNNKSNRTKLETEADEFRKAINEAIQSVSAD